MANSKISPAGKRILAIAAILLGILLLIVGAAQHLRYVKMQERAVTVEATICKVDMQYSGQSRPQYLVYVEYDCNGEHFEELYKTTSTRSWQDRIGQTVSLAVDPEDPAQELDDVGKGAIFWAILGAALVFTGALMISGKIKH